jgi:hypothetical protein
MRPLLVTLAISLTIVCLVPYLVSVPVRSLDLEKAVAEADLIASGRVVSLDALGDTTVALLDGTVLPASRFRATLKVDRVLKGDLKSQNLFFEFLIPESPVGLKGADSGQYSIFSLRESKATGNSLIRRIPICLPYRTAKCHPALPLNGSQPLLLKSWSHPIRQTVTVFERSRPLGVYGPTSRETYFGKPWRIRRVVGDWI